MSYKLKPILIVAGEPNSVFLELFFKAIKNKQFSNPLILIASFRLIKLQMKKLKYKKKIRLLDLDNINNININNKSINLINVNYSPKKAFEKISKKSNKYLSESFSIAAQLLRNGLTDKFINGPISKKHFLGKKYLGVTEYLSKKFKSDENAMLIYNPKLSVCPITTHLPIKKVTKQINQKLIYDKVILINNFYKKNFYFKPRIGVLGLNPHCESISNINEDEKVIQPIVKKIKKLGIKISGPHSADTIFMKKNRIKFDVIIGMYHDQVLAPIKTIFEYDAINITLGLPFIRISPDHGPNERMMGKNISNPLSLIRAISFLDKKN
tara:strand:+ start:917 stop:1891 length:975 start_codon:yes stop_codon:yes gene_type:complete